MLEGIPRCFIYEYPIPPKDPQRTKRTKKKKKRKKTLHPGI
jgi:hypothetical protein